MVRIKMHGPLKQVLGADELMMELPTSRTLRDLLSQFILTYPEMGFKRPEEITASHMLFIGSRVANIDVTLSDADVVTLFPFVDGG